MWATCRWCSTSCQASCPFQCSICRWHSSCCLKHTGDHSTDAFQGGRLQVRHRQQIHVQSRPGPLHCDSGIPLIAYNAHRSTQVPYKDVIHGRCAQMPATPSEEQAGHWLGRGKQVLLEGTQCDNREHVKHEGKRSQDREGRG